MVNFPPLNAAAIGASAGKASDAGQTSPERLSVRKRAIGWAKFRAYMLQAILA
jgi:hypothetical protein